MSPSKMSFDNNNGALQLPRISEPPTLAGNSKLTLVDQTTKAEALLTIKGIESCWSYSSFDNLPNVRIILEAIIFDIVHV